MIYLGLDPGTSGNMALAALLPETEGITSLHPIRVALVESGTGGSARERASGVLGGVYSALARLNLPPGPTTALAVEWQQPRPNDRRPQNILDLQGFMGIATGVLLSRLPGNQKLLTPLPSEWKGQVPKHVKHNRIVAVAGLSKVLMALRQARIPVPPGLGDFKKEFTGMASDVLDAIGLAFWLRERLQLQALRDRATMRPSK
jgi:hypothetical protein